MSKVRGAYLWSDRGYLVGYRIQTHWRSKTCRLLSPAGRELIRGTHRACESRLTEIAARDELEPPTGQIVVLLHGLARTAWSMSSLHKYLCKTWPEVQTVSYQYASMTATIEQHALYLTEFLESFRSASTVHFVGHSLGNILLRRAYRLVELDRWKPLAFGRHVMLGPPNQGSRTARLLAKIAPLRWIDGPSFLQLGRDWEQFKPELATPPCPFGIIAGRLRLANKINFLLDGPNDTLLGVDETRLDGCADFVEIPVSHTWLMSNRKAQEHILSFLQNGRFLAERPI